MVESGALQDFREEELWEKTEVFGQVAHRFLCYRKTGLMHGQAIDMKGMKSIQFVMTPEGWKISALAWDDERKGLEIPGSYLPA